MSSAEPAAVRLADRVRRAFALTCLAFYAADDAARDRGMRAAWALLLDVGSE
jgi:hypothetical protein